MNEFYQDILKPVIYHWALSKESVEVCQCSCQLWIQNKELIGAMRFHQDNIVELSIKNKTTNEIEFYLHFQMYDFKSSIEKFESFFQYLQNNEEELEVVSFDHARVKKILLSCSSGLTTSYFAYSMQEILNKQGIDIEIDAIGYLEIEEMIHDYDLVLLAPQISYMYLDLKKIYGNKMNMMDSYDFATSNFGGILEKVLH